MNNENRFLIIWNTDRTIALIIDTSNEEYIKLNVNSTNQDQSIDPKAEYVVAELPYSAVEALVGNFIEQKFWSPNAVNLVLSSTYGDAIKDVDELLGGTEIDPLNTVELSAVPTPDPPKKEENLPTSLEKFKGSINIIASGESKVIIGDTGIKSIIDKVDNK